MATAETTQYHHDQRRRLGLLALLAAAALAGSFRAGEVADVAPRHPRRLAAKAKVKAKDKRIKRAFLPDPKTVVARTDAAATSAAAGGPNVIYVQHEGLSGAIALGTKEGRAAMPFFRERAARDPDFYAFEHARTVSGIALDAMPALMTGCLPYDKKALKWAHAAGRSVGFEFKRLGYHTASFCSRALGSNLKKRHWTELHNLLVGGMDRVVDPLSQKWRLDNKEGSDDRRMLPVFEQWLAELAEGEDPARPFYAQFYNFNQHYPYARRAGASKNDHRYYQSLGTTNEFLRSLFEILDKTGRLRNTIIVGSGNFGDEPFKAKFAGHEALSSNILQPLSYIYYPRHLLPDPGAAARLRGNTQRLMHTLDLYPTIQGILRHAVAKGGGGNTPRRTPRPAAASAGSTWRPRTSPRAAWSSAGTCSAP